MTQGNSPAVTWPHKTTIYIPSIHCSSCIAFISGLLRDIGAMANVIDSSVQSHRVVIGHDVSLDMDGFVDKLEEAGYEVQDILVENNDVNTPAFMPQSPDRQTTSPWFTRTLQRLSLSRSSRLTAERAQRHAQHCIVCKEMAQALAHNDEKAAPTSSKAKADTQCKKTEPFVTVDAPTDRREYRAVLTIDGMTCSSCVGAITQALEERPWVTSANVGLLARTATVEFDGQERAEELVRIVSDLGYDAVLDHVEEVVQIEPDARGTKPQILEATFSIRGMTCSSCVGCVTEALEEMKGVKNVNVNLLTSSATMKVDDKSQLAEIITRVTDLGFEATFVDLQDLSQDKARDTARTVSLRVDGMYCPHCPERVRSALCSFDGRVTVQASPTLENPITTFSYQPDAPNFTIRTILAAVNAADPAFQGSVHHPPSVEERSRQMLARTRRRLFYRVLLSLAVAIPTFIIGIVYMNLVPPSTPGHHTLMAPWANVARAEWALLIMATPVYFFAADIFHRSTIKGIYALWRPGSTVPLARRFYKFGSMDMLISFATSIAYFSSIAELAIAATSPRHEDAAGMKAAHVDAVVFLTLFLLIGRLIEVYSKAKTGDAVTQLGSLRPQEALLVLPAEKTQAEAAFEHTSSTEDGRTLTENTSVDLLDRGDLVKVVRGASPPWDGILVSGQSDFVESSLTGESRPVKKRLGDTIYSGTVNHGSPVIMRVTGASGDSLLDQIIRVVREGQARRAPIERVADTITGYFVPVATLIAITTWLTWLALGESGVLPHHYQDVHTGGWPFWSLQFAIAVFVIACPCGIGLAAPTALFVGGGLAAKHGILAKGGGEAFQEASRLDIIVFDKTGTLTEGGEPKLTDHKMFPGPVDSANQALDRATVLGCLGELESNSTHPVAKAVVAFCKSQPGDPAFNAEAEAVEEIPGKGMKALMRTTSSDAQTPSNIEMIAGNEALMADHEVAIDDAARRELDQWKEQAKSVVLTACRIVDSGSDRRTDNPTAASAASSSSSSAQEEPSQVPATWTLVAIFATSDPLRPEAASVLRALRKQHIDLWMISGDNSKTANAVGAMVGIPGDHIIADVLPEQKAEKVKYLQQSQVRPLSRLSFLRGGGGGKAQGATHRRATVAMVGDGVNDSPALTVADVGIAIGSGSDVAISAAEFVLVNSNLTTLLTLTSLSRAVFRRVKFNFAWASVYNMIALPVAAGVLYPIVTNGSHTRLEPVWAALAMALSSVSVVCSSLLLKTRLPIVGYRTQKIQGRRA